MRTDTEEDFKRKDSEEVIKETLRDEYVRLTYDDLSLAEASDTTVSCTLHASTEKERIFRRSIRGKGKGMIDALFNALVHEYSEECVSVSHLKIEEFFIFVNQRDLRKKIKFGSSGSDACVSMCLVVDNGNGGHIPFRSESHSVIKAMTDVVFSMMEFFINCERAMLRLRLCVEDALERKRPQLAERYTFKMAKLVHNTSYIESLRGTRE